MEIDDAILDYLDEVEGGLYEEAEELLLLADQIPHQKLDKGYSVHIPDSDDPKHPVYSVDVVHLSNKLAAFCHCSSFKKHKKCKHAVAAVLFLKEELDVYDPLDELYDQEEIDDFFNMNPYQAQKIIGNEYEHSKKAEIKNTERDKDGFFFFQMDPINVSLIYTVAGGFFKITNNDIVHKVQPVVTDSSHHKFNFKESSKQVFSIDIIFDGKNGFRTKCSCHQKKYQLCHHIGACFLYINELKGPHYFKQFKDHTEAKNQFLKKYGLTVDDPEAKYFEFGFDSYNGNFALRKAPDFIIPHGQPDFLESLKKSIVGEVGAVGNRSRVPQETVIDYEVGFMLNFASKKHIGLEFETIFVREKKGKADYKKLQINNESNWSFLQPLPDSMYSTAIEFSDTRLIKWLSLEGGSNLGWYSNAWSYFKSDGDMSKLKRRYFELLQQLWPDLCDWPYVYILPEGKFTNNSVKPIRLGKEPVQLCFRAEADSRFVTITSLATIPGKPIEEGAPVSIWGEMIFEIESIFYLPASTECLPLIEKFRNGFLKFPLSELNEVLKHVLLPLKEKYSVEMKGLPHIEFISSQPQPRVLLSELNDQYLMVRPQFLYEGVVINYDDDQEYADESEGKIKIVARDKAEEKKHYEYLRTLHPKFSSQRNNLYYYLPFNEVMVKGWFLSMVQKVQADGFSVYGLQELKKFKYNTNKPVFEIQSSSGIDWFDLKISAAWADQLVSLKDLRKAIINNQDAVLLGDGTLGLIPQEWIKQYTPLMKVGSEDNGSIRLSKLHYTLLDDINSQLDNEEVQKEIAEKKKKLLQYDTLATTAPSREIKATLRPYQLSGFQWMQALDELGWGGCLADDMGLGKTLQTITFLQYLKDKHPGNTHLVVCPTSLIFNWESELQKFCPSLNYHTYYGLQRTFDDDHFEKFDIILTTYGMIRNDLDDLSRFDWHYVILDESQAIKNPEALVTRAVQKLKAKNRLVLSGTPVQNNTYDLYAQFTFLNPGFLGSREFFKDEYAHAIDKHSDKEKAEQLRRMIYPFMLRRTKEQVAKDLPDKTEMVLWCSMNKAQRHVYDVYKEYYREMLLQKIDEEGIAKAGIYVLEGLLRLRQICDHPALVKDKKHSVNESVKTEELMREIQENTGDHKLLVFSQFTEMLSLIRNELTKAGIKHAYLDGSLSAGQRKVQVQKFQDDETIKVFLISLKAGGVGLNLTAADYVYLVDPWWNPAAEQQAIDRTHRIGQTKKIFAYKMICKDSIEEKILHLQEKKKALAQELVSEDTGFVKKLSREDIEYLFG